MLVIKTSYFHFSSSGKKDAEISFISGVNTLISWSDWLRSSELLLKNNKAFLAYYKENIYAILLQ